jgi:iron complex outermembrane receptor protein
MVVVQIHLHSPENSGNLLVITSVGMSINWNPIEDLTLDGTIRSENYSDFNVLFGK